MRTEHGVRVGTARLELLFFGMMKNPPRYSMRSCCSFVSGVLRPRSFSEAHRENPVLPGTAFGGRVLERGARHFRRYFSANSFTLPRHLTC